MKYIFFIVFVFSFFLSFGQSKKKQIRLLNKRLYSLKSLEQDETSLFQTKKSNLEALLDKTHQEIDQLKAEHVEYEFKRGKLFEEKSKLQKEVNELTNELEKIEDSIQALYLKQPLVLSNSNFGKLSSQEAQRLFNVEFSDRVVFPLGNIEILARQDYTIGRDSLVCIVFEVTSPDDYYGPAGANFIGLLRYINNKYIPLIKPVEAGMSVGYGNGREFEGFKISGNKSLAVICTGWFWGQGVTMANRSIYLVNKEFIKNVLDVEKHFDDSGVLPIEFQNINSDWDLSFIDNKSDYFSIEVVEKSHNKIVNKRSFKFNEKAMKYE